MNREQKAAAIAEIADQINESGAVFAVDFRGISVPQAADVRTRLRDADATFRVVKNTLTERAADQVGAEALKPLLAGPTALTFVRGDVATAAKAIAGFNRETQLLAFKGGLMDGDALNAEQIVAISRLPSREVLYGQLVGVVASPITGVVRTLNALIAGVAIALEQVREKKESGELPAGDPPAASTAAPAAEAEAAPAAAPDAPAESAPAETATEPAATGGDAPAAAAGDETPGDSEAGAAAETPDQDAEAPEQPASTDEPAEGAPATSTSDETNDDQADASA